jgi:hypothetical protein
MRYDPGAMMKNVLSIALNFGDPDTDINALAREAARIARLEGIEFDSQPDAKNSTFKDAVAKAVGF